MDYKLAEQLRDAGFPQGGNGKWIGPPDKIVWRSGDRAYVPTLEELIAASGYPFYLNSNHAGYWYAGNAQHSEALTGEGDTPEDAVAKLWLALTERRWT